MSDHISISGLAVIKNAYKLAHRAHAGQIRRGTTLPYVSHPLAVARLVASLEHEPCMVAAALLHDVVDDTESTLDDIARECNDQVAGMVWWLSDSSVQVTGKRSERKAALRSHLAQAPAEVQIIKLCDVMDNLTTVTRLPLSFVRVYIPEKQALVKMLDKGDEGLRERVLDRIQALQDALC